MTLTLDLPPNLEKAVRELAAARGESVEHLARRALARWVAEAIEDAEDDRAIRDIEARGEARLTDWEGVKSDWDALPHRGGRANPPCP